MPGRATAARSPRPRRWPSCGPASRTCPTPAQQPLKYGEAVKIGDVEVSLVPAGHILGSAQAVLEHKGQRIVVSGDYKRRPDRHLPAVRARTVRRLHHRGDLRAAGVPSSLRCRRDRQAAALARDLPRAHSLGGRLCARQVPARDHAPARRGLRQAHLAAWRPRLALQALPGPRRRSRRHRAGVRCHPRDLQGRHRALPALGHRRPLVAPLLRADPVHGLGLDGRARPRPPARRRAAADHLRPCRLERAHPDPEGCRRAQGLGDARPRGGAGPPCALDRHRGRGAASRRPRGDEDES